MDASFVQEYFLMDEKVVFLGHTFSIYWATELYAPRCLLHFTASDLKEGLISNCYCFICLDLEPAII